MEELQIHIIKQKKQIRKGYTMHESNYMTLWKRQNHGDSKKIVVTGGGEMNGQSTEDF